MCVVVTRCAVRERHERKRRCCPGEPRGNWMGSRQVRCCPAGRAPSGSACCLGRAGLEVKVKVRRGWSDFAEWKALECWGTASESGHSLDLRSLPLLALHPLQSLLAVISNAFALDHLGCHWTEIDLSMCIGSMYWRRSANDPNTYQPRHPQAVPNRE